MDTVQLTGDGATGLVVSPQHRAFVSALPLTVRLGRNAPRVRRPMLRLEQFVGPEAKPPATLDYYTKAASSIARMYKNDQYGCCVFSGKGHNLGVWSANDPDSFSGQTVLCTDKEITDQYFAYTGGQDNGAVIAEVLDYMVTTGFTAAGKKYKLKGWCAFDWRNKELTQTALALGGAISIGFSVPNSWMNSSVWDYGPTDFAGGHDVSPCGYGKPAAIQTTKEGVIVASWGRLYLFTWDAWLSTRYIDEAYFMVPDFLWTGTDGVAPIGVNLSGLVTAMNTIRGGGIPPLPDPIPPDPPTPPVPPVPPPVTGGDFAVVNNTDQVAFKVQCLDKLRQGWTPGSYNMIYLGIDTTTSKRLYYYGHSFYKFPVPTEHRV